MQMEDAQRIPAPQAQVWAALNDPEILKACIPGCQSLTMTSPTDMVAKVVVRVGPLKGRGTALEPRAELLDPATRLAERVGLQALSRIDPEAKAAGSATMAGVDAARRLGPKLWRPSNDSGWRTGDAARQRDPRGADRRPALLVHLAVFHRLASP